MTDLRNRGWGLRCYQLLLQYCFETLRLHLVWLWTADFNSPAIHLYEKLGFQYAGRLAHGLFRGGRFRDLLLMSLLKTDWETNPCTGITKT